MKKKILKFSFILLFLISSSCISENGLYVEVKNMSDNAINDVSVFTTDKKAFVEFDNINPKENMEIFLDMSNITESDGGYMIKFKRKNGIEYRTGGGYYTNGGAINRKIIFIIKNDTVLVNTPLF